MTGADVVLEARRWLETPYAHQACKRGVGADCIGFVAGVAVALGLPGAAAWAFDPAVKGYGKAPNPGMLVSACYRYLAPLESPAMAVCGDVLVFRFMKDPQHFAIVSSLNPWRVIHSYETAGKVCENGIDGEWRIGKTWRSLIVSAWRFRGIEN